MKLRGLCSLLCVTCFVVSIAQAQVEVISVDLTPLVSPGVDGNGNALNTMGLALQTVDQGSDFDVTEITPEAFRILSADELRQFDLIAILNDPNRTDDGNPAGLGTHWHDAIGIEHGGRVVLSSHDPVRFHMNQFPPNFCFSSGSPGPGIEPFGARDLVRQAALWSGGGPNTGLLIFNDAPAFVGGDGWDNSFLNLPAEWGIVDSSQADLGDGGYTDILTEFESHPIYAGLSDVRLGVNTIASFAANLGDVTFHSVFETFNATIFTPTEKIINAGVTDVDGLNPCFPPETPVPGPDGLAITLIRGDVREVPTVTAWGMVTLVACLVAGLMTKLGRRRAVT